MHIAYVLYSESSGKHYYGYTTDIEVRLNFHNDLGDGFTKRYRPWKVIYTKAFENKKEAMNYEKWLKSGVGREFVKSLAH